MSLLQPLPSTATYRNFVIHSDILLCPSNSTLAQQVFQYGLIRVVGKCICQCEGEVENCLSVRMEDDIVLLAASNIKVVDRVR